MFRIQKVLLAEFEEIYEPVIIENPFTLIDENGNGLRQYYIGLTATKLLFGCDDFGELDRRNYYYKGIDPAIETFELVSMLPLQFVRLHFYRKKNRALMKIIILGERGHPMTFEFGGHIYKNLLWNTWRERVASIHLMEPKFFNLTYSSPFSSSDIILEDEVHKVILHTKPRSTCTYCYTSTGSLS